MHVKKHWIGELVEVDHGGHSTVFRTRYKNRSVAVKVIRAFGYNFEKYHSRFCREAVVWRHLRHPNILPLLGVDLEEHQLSMISEWMNYGNINEFVERQEGVNPVRLLVDAANGLEYMHSLNMVHGDLKGANILVNRSRRACLADFGLSTVVRADRQAGANTSFVSLVSATSLVSFTAGGTHRWMSPELYDPERFGATDDRPTKQSDCYALGMVVYEVLTGNDPFWEFSGRERVIFAIIEGDRPRKPNAAVSLGLTDGLWEILQRCWLADANARPNVKTVLLRLNRAAWSWDRRHLA